MSENLTIDFVSIWNNEMNLVTSFSNQKRSLVTVMVGKWYLLHFIFSKSWLVKQKVWLEFSVLHKNCVILVRCFSAP